MTNLEAKSLMTANARRIVFAKLVNNTKSHN